MVSVYDVEFTSCLGRRARTIIPSTMVRAASTYSTVVKNARDIGARLFNLLPAQLRMLFENHLDVFLSSIPDQPTMTGLGREAETNSLLHQLPIFYTITRTV